MVLLDNGSTASRRVQAFVIAWLSTYVPQPGRLVEVSGTDHGYGNKSE